MRLLATPGVEAAALRWSQHLSLPMEMLEGSLKARLKALAGEGAVLVLEPEGLGLYALDMPGSGAVRVELAAGALGWRVAASRARQEMVVKACGLLKAETPWQIFDATAGLLRDAAVLAAAGATVTVAERSPVVAALIEDGLQRARTDAGAIEFVSRITFLPGDALALLQSLPSDKAPEVVYLDPMFPHRDKTALVKKEMRVFRAVVGDDADSDALLAPARALAKKRVVVKRPRLAPWLDQRKPDHVLEGKSGRFDIYFC